jgi:hypothetical protein
MMSSLAAGLPRPRLPRRLPPAYVARVFALADERAMWERRVADAWRDGVAHAEALYDGEYQRGWDDGVAHAEMVESARRRLRVPARVTSAGQTRWVVRGERRTRATFGRPHKDDYTGGPVPKW